MQGEPSGAEQAYYQLLSSEMMTAAGIIIPLLLILYFFFSVCARALTDSPLVILRGSAENDAPKHDRASQIRSAGEKYLGRCRAGMIFNSAAAVMLSGCVYIIPLAGVYRSAVGAAALSFILSGATLVILQILVLMLAGCALPSAITARRAERILIKLSMPLKVLSLFFIPVSALNAAVTGLLTRLLVRGEKQEEQTENPTEERILMIADEGEENGTIEENTRSMIENVFEFDDTAVGEIMTHRKDIVAVREDESLSGLVALAIESGRSRLPVYHDDIDNIIGVIYVKDLLRYVGKTAPEDRIDPSIIRTAVYVPESKRCSEMFEYMTANKTQIAVVVDEFGGTGGIITMEDLIESILGNIQDEYDNEDDVIKRVNEYSFTVDGAAPLDEIEDLTGISFDGEESDTIAGIMLDRMGHIPKKGEHPSIMINGTRFTVLEADQRRISRILIVKSHKKSQ